MSEPQSWMPHYVNITRFGITSLNFIMSVIFVLVLLTNAFTMDNITAPQVFHADRVLQSSNGIEPVELDQFIKQVYGINSEILPIVNETTILPTFLPKMYEISGTNSMLRIEAVHSNFLLFSALWVASAFALAMAQVPAKDPLHFGIIRVTVVHVWNFVGLIATMLIFTATTKWANIPTSNLFYALIAQVMGWTYQYFHMVECTQLVSKGLSISHHPNASTMTDAHKSVVFSAEMRKLIYMEFSVVVPMLLVACMVPGSIGIDEWRVQTVLFASWTFFALLGLHIRYRKSLMLDVVIADSGGDTTIGKDGAGPADVKGLDALGYLTYAIVMVFAMMLNAMGSSTFEDLSYATPRITQTRMGARFILIVCAVLALETIYKTIRMRFFHSYNIPGMKPSRGSENKTAPPPDDWSVLPSFSANVVILAVGSFLVKVLIFSGLSDINGLSTWYVA
jgi:hypothetical protein